MGQYYKTAFMLADGRIEVMHPHHYDNGLKLMEHSYVGNNYVNTVIQHLVDRGICRMAHVGDYSDDLIDKMTGKKNYARKAYSACWGKNCEEHYINPEKMLEQDVYIVNLDKRECIRAIQTSDWDAGQHWIASLMLLIAMGNGMGSGDYRGKNEGLVGRWACDRLCVSPLEPTDCVKIHGWEFKEEW